MATQPRPHYPSNNQELELLGRLLESPPAAPNTRLTPIVLRSIDEQRNHALRGFLRRTWVDGLLKHTEWMLLLTAIIAFAIWFADGPLRDWLYLRAQAAARPAAPRAVATAVPATKAPKLSDLAASLPFVTSDMEQPLAADEFIAPRRIVPPEPLVVAPQPTRLMAPSIAVDTPVKEVFVVDGVWEVADYAAGYLHGTALPGDGGNTVLAGHAGLRGAVFRDLGRLAIGDDVYLDAGGWRYHYRVRSTTAVWPTQVEVLAPTETPVLTMITCTNWDTQRLVVIADLVDSQPSPAA